jgi:hypothetical protein
MDYMGTVVLLYHSKVISSQLKCCVKPGTATLRVLKAPQNMINGEHDYNVRNSSLSTHFTEGVQYRAYFNSIACITSTCNKWRYILSCKEVFLSYNLTL